MPVFCVSDIMLNIFAIYINIVTLFYMRVV